jgi:hypothetical protein
MGLSHKDNFILCSWVVSVLLWHAFYRLTLTVDAAMARL